MCLFYSSDPTWVGVVQNVLAGQETQENDLGERLSKFLLLFANLLVCCT